jgi:hypothetical protein
MIVSRDDIKMNLEKVKAIVEWKKFKHFWNSSIFIDVSSRISSKSSNHCVSHQKRSVIFMIEEVSRSIR